MNKLGTRAGLPLGGTEPYGTKDHFTTLP